MISSEKTVVPYDTMSTTSVRTEQIFTKCCCCVPLRVGCFILGYLSLALNTFHTLALITVATYIGISTHGFDHFDKIDHDKVEIESVEKPFLTQIGVFLLVVLCANIAWLALNIACLVGLHKKRPGPIRVYVGFATGRFLLSLASFVYILINSKHESTPHFAATHSLELGLAAYFVLVYYIYAVQLEREIEEAKTSSTRTEVINDIAFIYPSKLDKQNLVLA